MHFIVLVMTGVVVGIVIGLAAVIAAETLRDRAH
jgi:hypothetical protein